MGESLTMTVLDSNCTKTVCSLSWLNYYLETLSPSKLSLGKEIESNSLFKFGSRELIKSRKRVIIIMCIAGKNIDLTTDVIETQIMLLLKKEVMKKSKTCLNFVNDKIHIFDVEIHLEASVSF